MQCEKTPADMTARIGGTIEEITAWEGTACVRVGDRVCAGDVLIRGVRGGTLSPALGVRARGRVRAETLHTISACAPKTETVTKPSGRKTHALSLTAGKRELFFSKSSRNFDSSCDIVRKNYALALPGVYRLPLALRFDTCEELLSSETQADAEETESALRAALLRELSRRLDGRGELREARYTLSETPELIVLTLHAVCIEEIGDTETKAG